jgi:hypothetical protein
MRSARRLIDRPTSCGTSCQTTTREGALTCRPRGRRRRQHEGPRSSSWMSDRPTSCATSCQTTTREGAQARSRYGCARRPATAAAAPAARRGLALDQLDAHASPAGGRGREVRRVDGRRSTTSPLSVRMQIWLSTLCTSMPRCSMAGLHLCGTRPRAPLWGFGHHARWRPAASSPSFASPIQFVF